AGGDGDGGRVDHLADAGADEGEAAQDLVLQVDDHARTARVAVAVEAGAGDRAQVDVDGAHPVAGLFGLRQGEADGGRLRVGEDDLGDGGVVGGGGVRAPRSGVDRAARGPGGDGGARDAGLVLALVGEEGAVVDVADAVEPVVAGHPEAVVDGEPGAGFQADRLQADVVGARGPSGGEEDLVGLDVLAGVGADDDGAVLAPDGGHGRPGADVGAGRGERLGDQFPGERLHAGQQALAADQDGDAGAEPLPGGGHLGGDDTAADHDEPSGHGLGAGGLPARPG